MTRSLALFGALILWLALAAGALAQGEPQKSPFGLPLAPGQTTAASRPTERSFLGDVWSYVLTQQQRINRELAGAVRQMKTGNVLDATLLLAFLSFMYGVLHAAGPGHGKAVISAYVLANEKTVRRGIMLSFLAAFFQALSAIAIVGVLAVLMRATSLKITAAEKWIETASWGFVALIGVWLLYGQVGALMRRGRDNIAPEHDLGHDHAHSHNGGACGCGHDHGHDHGTSRAHAHSHAHADAHDHGHHHHADGACCDHAHIPDPKQLEGPLSWSKAIAIALSVGIRPCTGAILVLVFALSQGLFMAGVFATFAMAFGTAITVSVLASLAVGSRDLATRLAGGEGRLAGAIATGAGLAGSMLVLLMGAAFFIASLAGGTMGPL